MIRAMVMFSGSLLSVGCAVAEGVCFRTAGEAVRGAGIVDAAGYRVESVARDLVGGMSWARVSRCGHPEWPVRMVPGGKGRPSLVAHLSDGETVAEMGRREVLVRAGAVVTVVSAGQVVRIELTGRAIESGAMGQRVRVRLDSDGAERLVMGVVKSADMLEMVR